MVAAGDRSGVDGEGLVGGEKEGDVCSRFAFNSSFIQKRFTLHTRIT